MYVRSDSLDHEVRLTVEAAADVTNAISDGADTDQVRGILVEHGFVAAAGADPVEMVEAHRTLTWLAGLVAALPDESLGQAVASVNRALAGRAVTPSMSDHDGYALHIHWTSPQVPLAGKVVVDMLMALAQTLCDHGVERFGRCSASDCEAVFYDATKNRSRRFCNDPKCASRTHTAAHRARRNS